MRGGLVLVGTGSLALRREASPRWPLLQGASRTLSWPVAGARGRSAFCGCSDRGVAPDGTSLEPGGRRSGTGRPRAVGERVAVLDPSRWVLVVNGRISERRGFFPRHGCSAVDAGRVDCTLDCGASARDRAMVTL